MNKLGFGFLRFPMEQDQIDFQKLEQLVDAFLAGGGQYFDTAHAYLNGKSEEAVKRVLSSRYPRHAYRLASKLPGYQVKTHSDCRRFFDESLARCGVAYFDVFMLHWLNRTNYTLAEKYREFDFLQELKASGEAKAIGFSYHDSAELLDEILCAHPEVDYVLLQINYLDWESPAIQSRLCYETAVRHNKKVIVMEPVKGGTLASVPEEAQTVLNRIDPNLSAAQHALRFAQSLPAVEIVLSGMNRMEQVRENLQPFSPLSTEEAAWMQQAAAIIAGATKVPCTGCGYCQSHCPKNIPIADIFRLYNAYARHPGDDWKITPIYDSLCMQSGSASDCIGCHSCEKNCPQKLPIPEYLKDVVQAFGR